MTMVSPSGRRQPGLLPAQPGNGPATSVRRYRCSPGLPPAQPGNGPATSVRRYLCSRGAMMRYAFSPSPSRSRSSLSSGSSPVSSFTRSSR